MLVLPVNQCLLFSVNFNVILEASVAVVLGGWVVGFRMLFFEHNFGKKWQKGNLFKVSSGKFPKATAMTMKIKMTFILLV